MAANIPKWDLLMAVSVFPIARHVAKKRAENHGQPYNNIPLQPRAIQVALSDNVLPHGFLIYEKNAID